MNQKRLRTKSTTGTTRTRKADTHESCGARGGGGKVEGRHGYSTGTEGGIPHLGLWRWRGATQLIATHWVMGLSSHSSTANQRGTWHARSSHAPSLLSPPFLLLPQAPHMCNILPVRVEMAEEEPEEHQAAQHPGSEQRQAIVEVQSWREREEGGVGGGAMPGGGGRGS